MASNDEHENPRVEPHFESIDDPAAGFDLGEPVPSSGLRGKILGGLVAVAAIAGFVGIAWYATDQGQKNPSVVVPMIRADTSPVKVLPEKPGGMKVPNRDKLIFMQITPGQKKTNAIRLLPPPEKPMAKPKASPKKKAPLKKFAAKKPTRNSVKAPPMEAKPPKSAAVVSPTIPPPALKPAPKPAPKPASPAVAPKPVASPAKTIAKVSPKLSELAPRALKPASKAAKPTLKPVSKPKPAPKVEKAAKINVARKKEPTVSKVRAYRVQLGAVKSKTGAEKEALRLTGRHKSVLGGLKVKSVRADLGKRGIYYRLQAGPLADRAKAAALCTKFKARKQGCFVIKP